jgi:hypothetical protein
MQAAGRARVWRLDQWLRPTLIAAVFFGVMIATKELGAA